MNAETLAQLNRINQEFYQKYADSFARTRRKIQPGVSRILEKIATSGNFLDIGCGNGTLARTWVEKKITGLYFGIDFSSSLIAKAKENILTVKEEQKIIFQQIDLNSDDWSGSLPHEEWDAIFCFAVLHHIPGKTRRKLLCTQLRKLLVAGKDCYISVWQLRNSPRLVKRIQPWESVEVDPSHVDPGDVLMDWRAQNAGGYHGQAFRFVHIFTADELTELAQNSGFTLVESFYSDGKEGNLGLYQHWK